MAAGMSHSPRGATATTSSIRLLPASVADLERQVGYPADGSAPSRGRETAMATKQQHGRETVPDEQGQRNAVIGAHVLRALGEPEALHAVQVRHLWDDCYRVNVLVGTGAAFARVAHSYFLVTDGDGNVLASTPRITRQY
jgi:hypothetical protein